MKKGASKSILLFIILLVFIMFVLVLYYAAVQGIIKEGLTKLFQR